MTYKKRAPAFCREYRRKRRCTYAPIDQNFTFHTAEEAVIFRRLHTTLRILLTPGVFLQNAVDRSAPVAHEGIEGTLSRHADLCVLLRTSSYPRPSLIAACPDTLRTVLQASIAGLAGALHGAPPRRMTPL